MGLRTDFLGRVVLGSAIGLGVLAISHPNQPQNKVAPGIQKEIENKKRALHREIEDIKGIVENMRRQGVPEPQLEKVAKVFAEDFGKRLIDLEKAEKRGAIEGKDLIPPIVGIGVALGMFLILNRLLPKSLLGNNKNIKPLEKNFLGEELNGIDWSQPIDIDKALKALKEFRDKQELLPEENVEIKSVLESLVSILERIKQINNKDNLTIGDKPKLTEIYTDLDNLLKKLKTTLKPEPDLKSEPIHSQWENLSTSIKVK